MNLQREVIPYQSREKWLADRARDITSTSVSALFGLSPYCSKFELFHRLKGNVAVEPLESERMTWGIRLQTSIARGVAEDNHWTVMPMDEYIRLPEHRIGSSFDYRSLGKSRHPVYDNPIHEPELDALLECKNVDGLEFHRGWQQDDFGIVAPDHIELQVQHQMLVSGLTTCYIAALVGGNRVELLKREYQPDVGDAILAACAAFWRDPEPEPDFHRDAAFISKLYGYSAEGNVIEADGELLALFEEYAGYRAAAKSASDNVDATKARILTKIGDAERVLSDGFNLSTKMVGEAPIAAYVRKGYRGFRLTERKA